MSNATIRKLEAELKDREDRLVALQKEIDAFKVVLESLRVAADESSEVEQQPAKEIRNAMVDILRDAGKALHYGEIYEQLLARGFTVKGKDPRRNVGAHLSIDERFAKRGEGRWGLTSWGDRPAQSGGSRLVTMFDRTRTPSQPAAERPHAASPEDDQFAVPF